MHPRKIQRLVRESSEFPRTFCSLRDTPHATDHHSTKESPDEMSYDMNMHGYVEKIATIARETMGFAIIGLQSSTSLK